MHLYLIISSLFTFKQFSILKRFLTAGIFLGLYASSSAQWQNSNPLGSTTTTTKVGIGTTAPNFPLSMGAGAQTTNTRIALWDDGIAANTFGIGINSGALRFNVGGSMYRFAFHDSPLSPSKEVFTILGTGKIGIGTTSPNYPLSLGGLTPGAPFETKIALWEGINPATNTPFAHGLGIGPNQFRLHLEQSTSRFSF